MATVRWKSTSDTNWATAGNWDTGSVPVGGDTVIFEHNNIDVLSGLDQSGIASALASLTFDASYTGKIGTAPDHGTVGTPLKIRASIVNIGRYGGTGTVPAGSSRINLDINTDACTVNIDNTCRTSADPDLPPVRIITSNSAALTIFQRKGRVGYGVSKLAEVCTITAATVGILGQQIGDCETSIGTGGVLTTLTHLGGKTLIQCAATTVHVASGTLRTEGSGAITTINCINGLTVLNSSGTVTTLNQSQNGGVDLTMSQVIRAITTANIQNFAKYRDNSVVTGTRTPGVGASIGTGTGGGVGDYG